MNNQSLWNSVRSFNLDESDDPYNFSVRLAFENKWSQYATQQAIIEYKKFMFLAATSNNMVSPSEIVDIVWHQHLIFTQSYNLFCALLGKRIEHIPSTHNPDEKLKFTQAKERTRILYEQHFGKQPAEYWDYPNIYDSIPLKKASRTEYDAFKILGMMLLSGYVVYLLLGPIISKIPNPFFLFSIISIWILFMVSMFLYYRKGAIQIIQEWQSSKIIANLTPMELVCIEKQTPSYIIHYYVSRMVKHKNIRITSDNKLTLKQEPIVQDAIEKVIYKEIKKDKSVFYAPILKGITGMPLLHQTDLVRLELERTYTTSAHYVKAILITASVLGSLMMLLLIRLTTGLIHDKNVGFLVISIVLCFLSAIFYVYHAKRYFWINLFPVQFEKIFIPENTAETPYSSWQWKYFLGGTIIATGLAPMVGYTSRHNNGNCGSSCGSSCSSCGGGGGGCGGGCGGCGGD
jgi:hypothetical protein